MLTILGWLSISQAGAATFRVLDGDASHPAVVVVFGTLSPSDGNEFAWRVAGLGFAVVVLEGPGGSAGAGIQIGSIIRERGYFTLVIPNGRCASACAYAWIAGKKRLMGKSSMVGFHGAYVMEDGRPRASSDGTALVKNYLVRLGLSERNAVLLTKEGPKSMKWLTRDGANRLGIVVDRFPVAGAKEPAAAPRTTETQKQSKKQTAEKKQGAENCMVMFEGRCF